MSCLQLAQEAIDLGASAEEKIREVVEWQRSDFQRDDRLGQIIDFVGQTNSK